MNTKEWFENIAAEYGQEAADKCRAILFEADRERGIDKMLSEFTHTASLTSFYEVCEALYDAGYRKFEIVGEDV